MTGSIDTLTSELWDECVTRVAAPDEETAHRWSEDQLAYRLQGFRISPIPRRIEGLAQKTRAQWSGIEESVCRVTGLSRDEFLQQFAKARQDMLDGGQEWQEFASLYGPRVYGAVRNIDWLNLFCWVLPRADTANHGANREIGRMVAAVYYTELMNRPASDSDYPSRERVIEKLEALWALANMDT